MFAIALSTMSIGDLLIAIVVIAAACALVFLALRQFGVTIPGWIIQAFWICLCAVIIIAAIRFVFTL